MSRRVTGFMAVLALAASLGVTAGAGATTGKTAHPGVQIDVGEAAHRIELLRPRGASGNGQPDSKNPFTTIGALIQAALPQNGIQYHGGPVVMGEKAVAIYWASLTIYTGGPQAGTTGTGSQDGSLVGYFLRNLGGSNYYNINTTYTDGSGNPIPNSLAYTGFWANSSNVASDCQVVSDSSIQQMIVSGFTSGKLTYDPSTVYAVFSAGKVNLGGNFGNCSGTQFQYCAYHGYFSYNGNTVLYAVMPYNNAYPGSCTSFAAGGAPNGDPGADAEVNTLAHEVEEANTDPRLNAWYDTQGYENADKCAWNFGTINLNNNTANITVGARNFLVQQNWLNLNGGSCAKGYSGSTATVPGAPTLDSATAGNAQVALGWSAPSSNGGAAIDGYYVYRGGVKVSGLVAGTTYTDSGLTNGLTYTYTVTAHNSVGESAQSNAKSATPTAPSNVPGAPTLTAQTANGGRNRGVRLDWTVPSNGGSAITGYRIYRATSSGTEVYLTTRSAKSTSWRDSGTTSGVVYYYLVSATNANGEGPQSNEASAKAR